MDVLTVSIYVMVLTIVTLSYLGSVQLLNCKAQISQIARKYILRMETVGYLTDSDRVTLEEELYNVGVVQVNVSGSTMERVEFGNPVYLVIRGQISVQDVIGSGDLFRIISGFVTYDFEERKMSTAKN